MKVLHSIVEPLRYEEIPHITTKQIQENSTGILLDRWNENGYSLGLWESSKHERYIIHIVEYEDIENLVTERIKTEYLSYVITGRQEILNQNWMSQEWWVSNDHIPEPQKRSSKNITGLEPLDLSKIHVFTERDQCNIDGHRWTNDNGQPDDLGAWCETCGTERD